MFLIFAAMGKLISKFIFWIFGWTFKDHVGGGYNRCVMIAAPHTSNWDLIFARAAFYLMDIPVRYTVKKEWMRFPFNLAYLALWELLLLTGAPRKKERRGAA
jgi:hypothetical protein